MIKELFTNVRPRGKNYILAIVALLILATGAGLAQRLSPRILESSNLGQVDLAVQPMGNEQAANPSSIGEQPQEGLRPADEFSAQLDLLGQKAREVSRSDAATAYDIHLEQLSRQGRAASAATRLPVSADTYAYYLDRLRILGQKAQVVSIKPVDANSFSAYLDQLRRMASEAQ
jgi:hypothetical protein